MKRSAQETEAGRRYLELQRKARHSGRPTDELIQLYALEGFLDRLARSAYVNRCVLKGGVLLAALDARRATRDIDLAAHDIENTAAHVLSLIREVAAIVLSVLDDDGEQDVMVLPITHSPPQLPEDAIEIPPATKQRLGLDSERSWIVITEANEFAWPGPDLRPLPGHDDSTIVHGTLPPKFFAHVRDRFLGRIADDKAQMVKRTD